MNKAGIGWKIASFLLKLIVVLALMVGIAALSFQGVTYYLTGSFSKWEEAVQETKETVEENKEEETDQAVVSNENLENTLVIVDGSDNCTEYLYVNLYNRESEKLDVILVPANARVTLGQDNLKKVQKVIPDATEDIEVKDISAAFGEDRYEILRDVFAEVTGLTFKGCDHMSLTQMQEVLDVGPEVSYHFASPMTYRDSAGNLKSIESGDQMLSGEEGLALICHLDGTRDEESARLDRASTYIGSFFTALAKSRKASDVVAKYEEVVTMNRDDGITSLQDIVDHLKADSVTMRIMQGGEEDGLFLLDSEKIQLQIAALARQTEDASGDSSSKADKDDSDEKEGVSSDLAIELFNAAYVEGLARRWQDYLTSEGYNISMIDSYQEDGVFSETRIRVREEGMGEDLLEYFPDAEIYVDTIATGGDVRVYLGSDSVNVPEITNTTEDPETSYYDGEEE